jgi:hypothetical protein
MELVLFLNNRMHSVMDMDCDDQMGTMSPSHMTDTNEAIIDDLMERSKLDPWQEVSPSTLIRLFRMEEKIKGGGNA